MIDPRGLILPDHNPTPTALGDGPETERRFTAWPITLPGDRKNPFRGAL
jgi:hypothetical protein